MASSAFKSTSKRSCDVVSPPAKPTHSRTSADEFPKKSTSSRRRSRSVVSRTDDIQFSNKRDNPLFHVSPPPTHKSTDAESGRRSGRRFRSLSRNPSPRSRNEAETDQEYESKELLFHSNTSGAVESPKTWSTVHPLRESSDSLASVCSQVPNWDDGASGVYFSEAEEQTINEFNRCILSVEDDIHEASSRVYETGGAEVMRSICDIPHDLVNRGTNSTTSSVNFDPGTWGRGPVDIVLDIRREYVKELELSEERARKLRADLAAEEHHGLELGRVLKELLPDSRVDSLQRCRPARKNSIERRRMSKRLTDEALAYFDECISISTFDSSDLSSLEDSILNLQASAPAESSKSVALGCSTVRPTSRNSTASSFYQDSHGDDKCNQVNSSIEPSNNNIAQAAPILTVNSESYITGESLPKVQENTRNCRTNKDIEKHGCDARTLNRQIDMDEYNILGEADSMLFDKVLMKNRADSGSVNLCGGVAYSAYPFSFIF